MIPLPGLSPQTTLLTCAALAVGLLIFLVARWKVNAFIALVLASLFVGLCSGVRLLEIAKAFQEGVGGTLGFIAVVVGLGTMLGKLLAESGGAEVVAKTFIAAFGEKRLHWTLMFVSFIVGLPVFFGVGVVLLIPIVFTLARETKLPLLYLGIPVIAGLATSHGLVPPHPGPMVAIEKVGADVGKTILWSLVIGLPCAAVAGPIFAKLIAHRMQVPLGGIGEKLCQENSTRSQRPGFAITLFTITLPVLLMLGATIADVTLPKGDAFREWADFLGSPLVAMLLAVLLALWSFGSQCGFNRTQLLKFTDDCVGPCATIFLVVGAGGGFGKVLDVSGVDDAISDLAKTMQLSPLLLGWLVAAGIRIAVGSATVAITLASAIMAPIAASSPVNKELLVVAMGAGSVILSHLNDGGFWFVKEYFNLTVEQTLKTWTVLETIVSVLGLVLVLIASRLVG
jgi:GntP family gluconate:H+ symporter